LNVDPSCGPRIAYNPVEDLSILADVGMTDGWHRPDLKTA
jgi:hypothetical protein